MTFIGINELIVDGFRILMFEIPAAPRGIPTSFKGHFYGRNGESLTALSVEKTERIRRQSNLEDWSQGMVPEATLDALDPDAISVARNRYKKRFKHLESEIDTWDDLTFLKKAKLVFLRGK